MQIYYNATSHGYNKKDIGITVVGGHKDVGNGRSLSIAFRNGSAEKVTKTGYIALGYDEESNTLNFIETSKENGFKIHVNKSGFTGTVRTSIPVLADWGAMNQGEYDLEFESDMGLYYIKGKNKIFTK